MAKDQSIFRIGGIEHPFTIIGNAMLQDARLSIEARGFLASVMSRRTDMHITMKWLQDAHGLSRDRTYAIISELEAAGYCIRYQVSHGAGGWGPMHRYFTDQPAAFLAQNPEIAKLAKKYQDRHKRGGFIPQENQPKQRGRPRKNPLPENPYTGFADTGNQETNKRTLDSEINKKDESSNLTFSQGEQDRKATTASGNEAEKGRRQGGLGFDEPGTADERTAEIREARDFERAVFEQFKALAAEVGLDVPSHLTSGRRMAMRRIFEAFGADSWPKAVEQIRASVRASGFLTGDNRTGFRLTFDLLFREDYYTKVIEGAYRPREAATVVPIVDLAAIPAAKWENRLKVWRDSGGSLEGWPASWGPAPGKPGCGVPAALLARYGGDAAA